MSAPFRLRVDSGPQAGQSYTVERSGTIIGRQDGNDIVLDDARLSRQHARLDLRGGELVVTDLGSANGTLVNGQRISGSQTVRPGDTIQIGESRLQVEQATPRPNQAVIANLPTTPLAGGAGQGATPRLIVQSGANAGREFSLSQGSLTAGRQDGNDIVLDDTQASRQHARFTVSQGTVTVTDLGSANGTLVNGQRISGSQVLRSGDEVRIGASVLRFAGPTLVGASAMPFTPPQSHDATMLAPGADATRPGGGPGPAFPAAAPFPPPQSAGPGGQPAPGWMNPAQPPPLAMPPTPVIAIAPPPPQSVKRRNSRLPLIIGGALALLLLCVTALAAGALFVRSRAGQSDPTPTTAMAMSTPAANPAASPSSLTPSIPIAGTVPGGVSTTATTLAGSGSNPAPPPPGAAPSPTAMSGMATSTMPAMPPTPTTAPTTAPPTQRPAPPATRAAPTAPRANPTATMGTGGMPMQPTPPQASGGGSSMNGQVYMNQLWGFQLTLPPGWTKKEEDDKHVLFTSPDGQANFYIDFGIPSAGLTATQRLEQDLQQTARADPTFQPGNVKIDPSVQLGGQPAAKTQTYRYKSRDGTQIAEADFAVVLPDQARYLFSALAVFDQWDSYIDTFNSILKTIAITGPSGQ